MTTQDLSGWGAVPVSTHWTCPGCGDTTKVERWELATIITQTTCEEARMCPKCFRLYSVTEGSQQVADASRGTHESVDDT